MSLNPKIQSQGLLADAKLRNAGEILTQGGEPTFTAVLPDKPEWSTAALGPEKLAAARRLAMGLLQRQFPGGLLVECSGKQYPGEPVPRWSLLVCQTPDLGPLWGNLRLLAAGGSRPASASFSDVEALAAGIAQELGVDRACVMPAYEDVEAMMRREDAEGRRVPLPKFRRSVRGFHLERPWTDEDQKAWEPLCVPAGLVMPLEEHAGGWRSKAWSFPHGDDLVLLPGDSPLGLRLPLHRLDAAAIRTALTVQVGQGGELSVFLPPVPTLGAFRRLVASLEKVLARAKLPPVVLEGYGPPPGEGLRQMTIIPDPGVIEVNLPPAADWNSFEAFARVLFPCAEEVGLRGFKYQFSGRKVASGGGAHIILGGPDLARNAFLRKLHLLPSLLRFVQNHPSLSYVFAGLFIGPSCQAPRVDESFFEAPYELEISLRALEAMPAPADPEKVDAILRNLLLDWNGNTHRAEISIDKFANPFMPNGRLGLVEFRAFEMTPDADSYLAMNALVRALAAVLVEKPYKADLVDWQGQLHDRFLLPHFLELDFQKVLGFLNQEGFSFSLEMFQTVLRQRFPVVGSWKTTDHELEVRQAAEPWPVLGEQPGGAGVARNVDASTDRLQIRWRHLRPDRPHRVAVNGFQLPALREGDEHLCGLRYRLFALTPSLQPQVPAHSPLEFNVLDAEGVVVQAFDYLNWRPQPGGYDGLPRNDREASARVAERLLERPERLGRRLQLREPRLSDKAPHTLDLRAQ